MSGDDPEALLLRKEDLVVPLRKPRAEPRFSPVLWTSLRQVA